MTYDVLMGSLNLTHSLTPVETVHLFVHRSSSLSSSYNYDSTSIRRPFDRLSKVIKVTVK